MRSESWSKIEKKHARELFDLALKREYDELIETINNIKVETADDVWDLHDMLGKKRKELNGKYDYRYSQLLNQGYLNLEELSVLGEDKMAMIKK